MKRNWPDHPCTFPGCDRTDEEHDLVVIYWNDAGNISVRVDHHMWPTRRDGSWIGTHGRGWSTCGCDRAAYRRARDRARSLMTKYGCEVYDRARHRFIAA